MRYLQRADESSKGSIMSKHIADRISDTSFSEMLEAFHNDASRSVSQHSAIPLLEWMGESQNKSLFSSMPSGNDRYFEELEDLELAYYMGEFREAKKRGAILMKCDDAPTALSALSTHMDACIASGDGETAYEDYVKLEQAIREDLANSEDEAIFDTSYFLAMRMQTILMEKLFDLPRLAGGIDSAPGGLRACYSFLLAMEQSRQGFPRRAIGISYGALAIAGKSYPIARIYLHLIAAASFLVIKKTDMAEDEFMQAWKYGIRYGILAPFVELNDILLGLPRRTLGHLNDPNYKYVESMTRVYWDGWNDLRERCGFNVDIKDLSPLQSHTAALASLGWRNKEIADQLRISQNTVKHHLTAAYAKTGSTKRSDISKLFGSHFDASMISGDL